MFLSAVQPHIVAIIIVLIVLQYAYALFCLLKLAYFDVSKRNYILWNLFILIVVFIGCTVFLVYYYKHPELRIKKSDFTEPPHAETQPSDQTSETADDVVPNDENESSEQEATPESNDGENNDQTE